VGRDLKSTNLISRGFRTHKGQSNRKLASLSTIFTQPHQKMETDTFNRYEDIESALPWIDPADETELPVAALIDSDTGDCWSTKATRFPIHGRVNDHSTMGLCASVELAETDVMHVRVDPDTGALVLTPHKYVTDLRNHRDIRVQRENILFEGFCPPNLSLQFSRVIFLTLTHRSNHQMSFPIQREQLERRRGAPDG
jgi:hypothetical protein